MRKRILRESKKNRLDKILTVWVAIILSIVSYLWSLKNGYVTIYNDAMSHLNISRLVIDNINPGMAQLGSVWLPLNHILNLVLIWNDWAWHSGFAGSIFSMIAYIISAWGIYKIIIIVIKNKWAGFIGSIAFAFNLNILYLQTTPLTEALYLLFFILSILSFVKWVETNRLNNLIFLGLLGVLQVLIRYDGWFVVGMEGVLVLFVLAFAQKNKFKDILGKFMIFALPIIFGIGLWLFWNLLIYGDPLYFMFGPYSAHSQQANIQNNSTLITKGNLYISVLAYWYDIIDNVGLLLVIMAIIGVLIFFLKEKKIIVSRKILLILLFFSPIFFNIISLYLGFSIINIPKLHWNPSGEIGGQWFNVRYGIFSLPLISFCVGVFSSIRFKIVKGLIFTIIIMQAILFWNNGIITLIDGKIGSSSFANNDIAVELRLKVKPDEKILISTSFFNAVLFKSGFNLKQFIHEGSGNVLWENALDNPENYAKWIVMANGDVGEPIYKSLVKKYNNRFLHIYKLEYEGNHANIYKRRDMNEIFFTRAEGQLFVWNKKFILKGVNSYDLAYRTDKEIEKTFKTLSKIGVNVIRFWAFGDGFDDGFQVNSGIINEERFKKMDYIILNARKYKIYLIPVLVNNWDDYGGKKQYLEWTGSDIKNKDLFFLRDSSKKLFKNYIQHVILRKNILTDRIYKDEPIILSWEIMNEPRISNNKQKLLREWVKEIARYIKDIDKNHLVSIGSEEEAIEENNSENKSAGLCSIKNIDICSVHLYLFHEDKLKYKNFNDIKQFLGKQIQFSKKENKPILLGEIGISKKTKPFNEKPLKVIKEVINIANKLNYNGYLIWNWASFPDSSFGFSKTGINGEYNSEDLKKILEIDFD